MKMTRGRSHNMQFKIPSIAVIATVLVFAGTVVLVKAAGTVAFEAENGAITTGVTKESEVAAAAEASNGAYITFTAPVVSAQHVFSETFDNNTGLNRFRWGVYHRSAGYREMDQPQLFYGPSNISLAQGSWTGDHDMSCGGPDTQRPLISEGIQDTTGQWGWHPQLNFHVDQDVYECKDHIMSSMGSAAGYSVLWFGPDVSLSKVNSVSFKVNLTDLGARKWWKVGVVSDSLWNSTYQSDEFADKVTVRSIVVSDVGASNLNNTLQDADRLIATWSGGASAGYPGCLKIGNQDQDTGGSHICSGMNNDKATRYPVTLVDNHNGTVTFNVNGTTLTRPGAFPACPCHVVFYDNSYTPDKDGVLQGHTWHWDDIVVD